MKSVFNLFLAVALPTALAFVPQKAHVTTTNYWGMTSTSRSDVRVFAEKEGSALNIIIAGAPASGKGTQCEVIKEKFGIVHLSTGDMLRAAVAAKTEVGVKAKDFMDSGKLVPDEVIIGIVGRQKERFFFRDLFEYVCDCECESYGMFLSLCYYYYLRSETDLPKAIAKRTDGCWMVSRVQKNKPRLLPQWVPRQTVSFSWMFLMRSSSSVWWGVEQIPSRARFTT
jgi:hypothetical protein